MVDGPAERHDAAPVVTEGHDGVVEGQRIGERPEVGDTLGERALHARALREPHVELVDRHHPPGRATFLGGPHRFSNEAAPEVRPRGIAVNRQDRSYDRHA